MLFKGEDCDSVHQTLSAISSGGGGMMFDVQCEQVVPVIFVPIVSHVP